jgi:CrcB protein
MGLTTMIAVGAGGFLGATLRYGAVRGVETLLPRLAAGFPLATLLVNVLGSGLLGYLIQRCTGLPPEQRLFWTTGLLGAFTTFSTLSVELLLLLRDGKLVAAGLYALLSLSLGLGAAWLGWKLASSAGAAGL